MKGHTSQRGLVCSFPFPKHLHPCSCAHPHRVEQATSKAQQRKRIEQRERTRESLNPVSPVLSPAQATLTEHLATPADSLTAHCIRPGPPRHSRSPASGTVEPLSPYHDQAEATRSTQGRRVVCLPRIWPHRPTLEQFSFQVEPRFSPHWL